MSTRVMALCWPLNGMTILQKSVLVSLADQANDEGICWPSVATICERVCASERAVQEAIRGLIDASVLKRNYRLGKPTIYQLTPAEYAPPQNMPPADKHKPPQDLPAGGAGSADITVIEPSIEPSINIKPKKSRASSAKTQELDFSSWPAKPSDQVLIDWFSMRKQKRASVSQTVINQFASELMLANAAGLTVDYCLSECITRNWQGFKFSWLQRANGNGQSGQPNQPRVDNSAAGRVRAAIARDRAARGELDRSPMGFDGIDVRPQVGEQLRGGSGPGQGVGSVLEGDFTRAD